MRTVAVFEATKGTLVLLAGIGALSFLHRDFQPLAERLVAHLHLNPARHYPRIFIDAAAQVTDKKLWLLAAFATVYGVARLVEAYGLWQGSRWAHWFAAISGGVYIPFEILELLQGVTWLSLGALVVNGAIVALMLQALRRRNPSAQENERTLFG